MAEESVVKSDKTPQQAQHEIRIFKMFSKIAPYPIDQRSIIGREPPEPDIFCYLQDGTGMSFELVECIDSSIAQTYYDSRKLTEAFRGALKKLPKKKQVVFNDIFNNALIYVAFNRSISQNKKRDTIPGIFEFLFTLSHSKRGKFSPAHLKGTVGWIFISRGSFSGPLFDVAASTSFADPTKTRIEAKFKKKYESRAKTELLAYYELQPELPRKHWLLSVQEFARNNIKQSAFQRLWIYSVPKNMIIYVYPPL